MSTMMRNGWWREMNPHKQPPALLTAGLGATPMQHEGRWYSRQTLPGGRVRALYFTGLGDASGDMGAANSSYANGTNTLGGAQSQADVSSACQSFLDSANSSLAVMNDLGNSSGATQVQTYLSVITTAKAAADGASDLATASPNGATAQAAASTALALAKAAFDSNKGTPGGSSTQGQGGGGNTGGGGPTPGSVICPAGTANAGQAVSDLSQCGGSTALASTSSSPLWPWIVGGVAVGGGLIALAVYQKKKGKKLFGGKK